jgi:hypothetical protein
VIFSDPYDLDPTVSERRGGAHRERVDSEVPGILEIHGEGVLAGFNGDGVLDGIQQSTARSRTWSSTSEASCKCAEKRLEIRHPRGELWT